MVLGANPDAQTSVSAWERICTLGGERRCLDRFDGGFAGVARRGWQSSPDFVGASLVLHEDGVVLAADASLYDRGGLERALRESGQDPRGDDVSHLILAAYRAWGPALVDHLIGDYAFTLWDTRRRRLLAARDPMGNRPLFYTRTGDRLGVASSSLSLARWRGTEGELNLACLGAQVAGTLLSMGTDSVHAGVEVVRPGFMLLHEQGRHTVSRFWMPPTSPASRPAPFDDAAREFRELLLRVVDERMGSGVSSVWMSGGWDSTAVFGAGRAALERQGTDARDLRPVSIRYPQGDPGYEDPWIEATAARWGTPVEWLPSEEIPLLDELESRAGAADEPPAHLYELWNVALARGSRRIGARIGIDGCGGDNLFQVSDVVIADFLRRGRLVAASRMARARRTLGWRYLVRHGLIPLVPGGILRGAERLTGRNVPLHHLEMPRVAWVPHRFVHHHGLRERDLAILHEMRGSSRAQEENMLYVTVPAMAWGGAYMRGVLLEAGVEARSPLLDRRVVEFALRRPVSDRTSARETKMLLRKAVEGWVPESVLASRSQRTGVASGYSARRMQEAYPMLLDRLFSQPLRLADLGIVEPAALRAAADLWRSGRGRHLGSDLFGAMRTEFWLRGRDDGRS